MLQNNFVFIILNEVMHSIVIDKRFWKSYKASVTKKNLSWNMAFVSFKGKMKEDDAVFKVQIYMWISNFECISCIQKIPNDQVRVHAKSKPNNASGSPDCYSLRDHNLSSTLLSHCLSTGCRQCGWLAAGAPFSTGSEAIASVRAT